jgi:hypothetical protein
MYYPPQTDKVSKNCLFRNIILLRCHALAAVLSVQNVKSLLGFVFENRINKGFFASDCLFMPPNHVEGESRNALSPS